jgi:3-hydroxyisobutyrate dehydrogenase
MTERIAVLGTGIMGGAMTRRLVQAGFDVYAWNRTRQKAHETGATVADSPEEAVADAGIALTMLADGEAVLSVMEKAGALAAMRPDSLWLQMSTIGIDATSRCVELAERAGISFVDAPVFGTKKPAEDGTLTVLASGAEDAIQRCTPVFDVVSNRVIPLGAAGNGNRMKIVVNAWLLGLVGALAESIAFARAVGVDPARFLEAIEGGPIGPAYAKLKGEMMVTRDYSTSFPVSLAAKDAALVLEPARAAGLDLPVIRAVDAELRKAIEAGAGDKDLAAIYEAVESV